MLKERLVSQLYINYIIKNYFINGLLFQEHILKFHYFFTTLFSTRVLIRDFSGPGKSKDEFKDFSRLFGPFRTRGSPAYGNNETRHKKTTQ